MCSVRQRPIPSAPNSSAWRAAARRAAVARPPRPRAPPPPRAGRTAHRDHGLVAVAVHGGGGVEDSTAGGGAGRGVEAAAYQPPLGQGAAFRGLLEAGRGGLGGGGGG